MKQIVKEFENGEVVEKTIYGFSKETIEKLKTIGIKPSGNEGQYCDSEYDFFIYDKYAYLDFQLSASLISLEEMDKYYSKVRKLVKKVIEITKTEYEEE